MLQMARNVYFELNCVTWGYARITMNLTSNETYRDRYNTLTEASRTIGHDTSK